MGDNFIPRYPDGGLVNPVKEHMMGRLEERARTGDEVSAWALAEIALGDAAISRLSNELEDAEEDARLSKLREGTVINLGYCPDSVVILPGEVDGD